MPPSLASMRERRSDIGTTCHTRAALYLVPCQLRVPGPGWQDPPEDGQDHERQYHDDDRRKQPLAGGELHLVRRVPEQALRKEVAADYDVPAHCEEADERRNTCRGVDPAPGDLG